MNKVILMGRLAREPEVRYSQGNPPLAVARFSLAVNRRFRREGEPDADFVTCVAFGKSGEFVERYFKKGQMVSVVGRLQVRSWDDKDGTKRWSTEVVVEENYFAESKTSFESREGKSATMASTPSPAKPSTSEGFYPIDESLEDDDLPF